MRSRHVIGVSISKMTAPPRSPIWYVTRSRQAQHSHVRHSRWSGTIPKLIHSPTIYFGSFRTRFVDGSSSRWATHFRVLRLDGTTTRCVRRGSLDKSSFQQILPTMTTLAIQTCPTTSMYGSKPILRPVHPSILGTLLVPKSQELVANPYRHNGVGAAQDYFESGFRDVFPDRSSAIRISMTVYYAFKQQDSAVGGDSSTGWEHYSKA